LRVFVAANDNRRRVSERAAFRWSMFATPAAWTVYLAWPTRGGGLIDGLPLSPLAAVTIAAIWLAQASSPRRWSVRWPVGLLVLKLTLAFAFVDHGFVGEYFANDAFAAPIERSVEFPRAPFTRIDRDLDFGPEAGRDLPMFFLNDARFAGSGSSAPYSVLWTGHLRVARDEQVKVFLHGKGLSGDLALDGASVVTLSPESADRRAGISLRAGWHQLRIAVSTSAGGGRAIYAGIIDASGVDRGFGGWNVYRREVPEWQAVADRAARSLLWLIDMIALAYLGVKVGMGLARGLSMGPLHVFFVGLATIVLVEVFRFAAPMADRLVLFGPMSRMIGLESQARRALLSGWTPGAGLHPSGLALLHLLFGEGIYGVQLAKGLAVGLPVIAVARLAAWIASRREGGKTDVAAGTVDIARVLAATGVILIFSGLPHRITGDASVRLEALASLLDHGRLSAMSYSMVGPLFSAPLYYLGKLVFEPGWWCARYNTVIFALTLVTLDWLLEERVDRRLLRTFFVVLVAASMFPNHLADYYSEVFTAACIAVGGAALAVDRTGLGWTSLVLGVVNTPAAMVGLALVAARETWNRRRLRHLAPVLAAALPIVLEAWIRRGSPFVTGYEGNAGVPTVLTYSGRPGFSYPLFFGLLSLMFSFGKGLVFFAPGLVLPMRADPPHARQPLYECYRTWMLMLAGLTLVYAKWWSWYGGWFWGPRFLLFASFPASLAVAVALRRAPTLRGRALLAVAVVVTLSVWVGINGAIFNQDTLAICLQDNYALEALCWYTPEFSALWRPFVVPTTMKFVEVLFAGYCGAVFAWLAAPLARPILAQGRLSLRSVSARLRRFE
jgi:hypothetical protein